MVKSCVIGGKDGKACVFLGKCQREIGARYAAVSNVPRSSASQIRVRFH
jgi:hypothetical protein